MRQKILTWGKKVRVPVDRPLMWVIVFVVVGVLTLVSTHAATPALSAETESGVLAGAAAKVTDSTASGANAVKFGVTGSGNFAVQGTKIIDPTGKEFIPVGANVNGPGFVWPGGTIGQSTLAQNYWHWNTIRLNICWVTSDNYPDWNTVWPGHPAVPAYNGCENGGGSHWSDNNNLDTIVNEYTAKKIVVMIDLQHFNPGDPISATNLSFAEHWWQYIANRYKGNPYVWYNLVNEPIGGAGALGPWNTLTSDLAGKVRGTGAQNIIVADGASVGQEADDWNCTTDIPYQNSAILTYGPTLESTYGNMLFALHAYNEWGGGNLSGSGCNVSATALQTQLDTRMTNFFNHVKTANVPLVIGEFGSRPTEQVMLNDWDAGQDKAVKTVFRIIPGKSIGALWWHGDNGSGYILLNNSATPDGCAWNEAALSNCTTRSAFGQQLYDFARTINP